MRSEISISYIVLDKHRTIIYADFSLTKTVRFLCRYAFKNEGFEMLNGDIPVKHFGKGIYNEDTFKRDYYASRLESKTVANYSIQIYDVDIQNYIDYLDAPRVQALAKKRKKLLKIP